MTPPSVSVETVEPSLRQLNSVRELQSRIREMQTTTLETKSLPTLPAFASILPDGALKQGAAYSIKGSMSLAMGLLAGPSSAGWWCGAVGVPELGVEAASGIGISLERLVLIPAPGKRWLTVTAALIDVLTVVLTRPPVWIPSADISRLSARLRQRGATLVILGEWPQAEARLSIRSSRWEGIGAGHGYLRNREVLVEVAGRSGTRASTLRMIPSDKGHVFEASNHTSHLRERSGVR
ncbi:hypothetical protein [Rathayibacter toxicus]|nr:hypothetical protein [Rathayibacter toxicus]ALS58388.1 hypothetical protein APU90_10585 [Rathayibacter toxicus]KKM45397.1 hypothetical protein VT73_06970 [Rathayibacter toxicus]QOD09206.1 hypothetical protein AYW78_05160 [Rathayibacter toxicus]QOD11357.1 hypothetical protein BSG36_05345 [Rathayibacter toxicus]QWL26005.1 hypothetical protein E2R32_05110 [Rathayibacter toxicus]